MSRTSFTHGHVSLMKQEFVATHGYTILQEVDKTWQILHRPAFTRVTLLLKRREKQLFCGINILLEGVSVTQLASNVGNSVW